MTVSEIYHKHVMQCWASQAEYQPIEVYKTEGCWIHTTDERKIFDLRSAHECINLGFNHPKVIEAVKVGLEKPIYVTDDFAVESTALLAMKLAEITPGSPNKKIWFGQSGAGSVEAAIKAARFHKQIKLREKGSESVQYPFPYKIISRYRAWHGSSLNALSAGGDPRKWFSEPLIAPGFIQAPDAYPYRSPFGEDETGAKAADYLEYMLEMEGGGDFVAAIMVEPVVGSNGIIPAPQSYVKRVRELCDAFDVLLIVDETMTGMGRTGKFLSIEHYDIEPDIIIMGKALGVYCPISATIMNEEVSASFDENIFGHGQSYSGHSLAASAALKSIEVLEDEVLPDVPMKAGYLQKKLLQLKEKYDFVGDVRGLGLMWTMELIKDEKTKESFRSFGEK
ncbi:MAG: aspartate aminotransferase family protein, partial [Balneolaceae bacterium]